MSKDRELHFLLDKFKKNPDRSILMVGEPPADLYIDYKKYKHWGDLVNEIGRMLGGWMASAKK